MEFLCKLERQCGRLEFLVACVAMLAIVGATAIAVISRNLLASPAIWTGELSLLAQVWLTFIGAAAVYKERGHVGMAGLAQALPPRLAGAVTAAADLVLAGLLIWVGIEVAALMSRQWAQTLSTLGLPRALTSLPVVWGMLSIAVSALLSAAAQARRAAAGERA